MEVNKVFEPYIEPKKMHYHSRSRHALKQLIDGGHKYIKMASQLITKVCKESPRL